jgi:hypothetical protein
MLLLSCSQLWLPSSLSICVLLSFCKTFFVTSDKGTQKVGAQSAAVCLTTFTALLVAQMQRTLESFIAIKQALTQRT